MQDPSPVKCAPPQGWTVDTLHQHIIKQIQDKEERDRERFMAQKEMTALALTAADRAVTKAEAAAEKRFESVNEFRNTLADQQRMLMPRIEAELWLKNLTNDISLLKESNLQRASRGEGLHAGWLILVGAMAFVGTVIGIFQFFSK